MLKRLFEWYRLVSPTPDDTLVERRTGAVKDLLGKLSNATDYKLLIDCTAAAANGLGAFDQSSQLVRSVVECIRNHQPAFPQDLSENALDLRACCAVAVGELLTRYQSGDGVRDKDARLAAVLIVPAFGLRSRLKQKYLQATLDELHAAAVATLQRAAVAKRERQGVNLKKLEGIKVAAVNTAAATTPKTPVAATDEDIDKKLTALWKKLLPALKESFASVERQAAADREELEVLWWLYNGVSEGLDQPLSALKPGTAAVCCGVEVADRLVVPPLASVRQMVAHGTDKNRTSDDTSAKSLEELVGQWEREVAGLLMPADTELQRDVRRHPALLPLSWLSLRLHEGNHAAGWNQEFEMKTGAALSDTHKPAELAVQAFNERVAQRLYTALVG